MIGGTIGNFRIVKRLGSGGMGEVYLAEHKEMQTPVAVKLLNRDISNNQDHCQRFFNEARVVSKIKHAGTVKIFDSGFYDGQAYLIMELLEGESLAGRIEHGGAMPIARILDNSRQIASVLDATHRQGVIHRDLKPDNIFLILDDERASGERVKVLDFGIAKLSGTLAGSSPKTSGTMGTPAYMAPEQWGDSSNVDWRADAYSLGCVMFEMACGRPPFEARNIAEAFTKHVTATPPTPSSVAPHVPPELDTLILRLLAKEPADRAVSMGQVVRELAELMGEPMAARLASEPGIRTIPTPAPGTLPATTPAHMLPLTPPAAAFGPSKTATTLGGAAAQTESLPPTTSTRKGPFALVAVGVALIGFVVVMTLNKGDKSSPQPASAPSPAPTPAPAVTSPAPPAPVIPSPAAADPVVVQPPATLDAGTPAPAEPVATVTPPVTQAPTQKPKPKPPKPKPPRPGTGSGTTPPPPPGDDTGFGGRI